MGRAGDADVQFEIYRELEDEGAVVVNRIDPLLAAGQVPLVEAARPRRRARRRAPRWRRPRAAPTTRCASFGTWW